MPVQKDAVTQKDFSSSELATVKKATINALKNDRMNITYDDYGANKR